MEAHNRSSGFRVYFISRRRHESRILQSRRMGACSSLFALLQKADGCDYALRGEVRRGRRAALSPSSLRSAHANRLKTENRKQRKRRKDKNSEVWTPGRRGNQCEHNTDMCDAEGADGDGGVTVRDAHDEMRAEGGDAGGGGINKWEHCAGAD